MCHVVQVHSWEEAKDIKIWESYHKFHFEIQIYVRPSEGRISNQYH
jgi:hypothetical protein